jgi:DNA invertase Pin-like site-specific DNA recombinase
MKNVCGEGIATASTCTTSRTRRKARSFHSLILARTGEGLVRAKKRGVRFGRPLKLDAYQREEARRRRDAGETLVDIARTYGVSHMTIARAVEAPSI